jgi:integrase
MTTYADAIAKPPRTLTELEQKLLLKTMSEHRDGYRDHVLISLALGTGLREHELQALDCGDVFDERPKDLALVLEMERKVGVCRV